LLLLLPALLLLSLPTLLLLSLPTLLLLLLETFQAVYSSAIGDLPTILLKHSSPDIEKAKTLASKLLAITFCWFIILFLIETGLSISLHSLAYVLKGVPGVWNDIMKPKTILRKKILKKSDTINEVNDDEEEDDN